jgi:Protein kinase domain
MGQRPLGLGCPQQGCLGGSAVPFADICAIASQERPIPSGVYAAYQGSMHRNVALKILEDAPLSTEGASRFEREAWIAGSLSHPNIVKVHAYGIAGNARYIAMELIDGPSLHEEIREAKKRQPEGTSADSDWRNRRMRMVAELFVAASDALHYSTSRESYTGPSSLRTCF